MSKEAEPERTTRLNVPPWLKTVAAWLKTKASTGKYFVIGVWLIGLLAVSTRALVHTVVPTGVFPTGADDCYQDLPDLLLAADTSSDGPSTQPPATPGAGAADTAAALEGTDEADAADDGQPPSARGRLQTLEPIGDQPVTIALGRSRGVRYGQAKYSLGPSSPDESSEGVEEAAAPSDDAHAAASEQDDGDATTQRSDDATPQASEEASEAQPQEDPLPPTDGLDDRREPVYLPVTIGTFVREDGATLGDGTPTTLLMATTDQSSPFMDARAWSRHGVVTVELCVDRFDGNAIGDPGLYVGSVAVVDPRIARTDVPFVITMSHDNSYSLLALLFVVVAVAAIYVWLLRTYRPTADSIDLEEFMDWLGTRTGVLAVGTGAVATYVAYSASYLADSTWGGSTTQLGALVGAAFTAFITAAATVISASSAASGPKMPDLTRESAEDARRRLERLGFAVFVRRKAPKKAPPGQAIEPGQVIETEPPSGRRTVQAEPVTLVVASEPEQADEE